MIPTIKKLSRVATGAHQIFLIEDTFEIKTGKAQKSGPGGFKFDQETAALADKAMALAIPAGRDHAVMHGLTGLRVFVFLKPMQDSDEQNENLRLLGDKLRKPMQDAGVTKICIRYLGENPDIPLALAEGMALGSYAYARYKTRQEQEETRLEEIGIVAHKVTDSRTEILQVFLESTAWARDLGNEPLNKLGATGLAETIKENTRTLGVRVEIFNKKRIESLRMGGLLAVNRGSVDPPSFSILEWKPANAVNPKPIVLVGKGVVFDTGGISLKPANNMEEMKADMAGAAAVAAVMMAVARLQWPLYMVALIPATDNRPHGNAYVPGDVITMYDGSTVEVINTDAEGRMILADALAYAKQYDPMLVVNLATLTGSAARATGKQASIGMHAEAAEWFNRLKLAGEVCRERLVEMPMWKEYDEMLRSEVADIRNVGGPEAGAITAGIFLKRFTSYPFIHLDIAGTAYVSKRYNYRGIGATGKGVRLLLHFLQQLL